MTEQYQKVTITIEEADGSSQTFVVYKSSHLRIDTRGGLTDRLVGVGQTVYPQTSVDLEMALTAHFSDDEGCLIRNTIKLAPAKEVEL